MTRRLCSLCDPANDPVFQVIREEVETMATPTGGTRSARLPVDAFANKDGIFLASTDPGHEFITAVPRDSAAGRKILAMLQSLGRDTS